MATIKIKFKDTLTLSNFSILINFTCNGVSYLGFRAVSAFGGSLSYYKDSERLQSAYSDRWFNTAYQVIEIDPTQTNFQTFITAMKSNIEGVELEAGTYQWIGVPENPTTCNTNLNFTSNNENFTGIKVYEDAIYLLAYINNGTSMTVFNYDDWEWKQGEAYITIITTSNQYIDYDFYNYAILGNQLVKQQPTPTAIKLFYHNNKLVSSKGKLLH